MSADAVRTELGDDGIAFVTIHRPDKRNALNTEVRLGILEALGRLEQDRAARVIVFTGEGEKAFVAGADIGEFALRSPLQQRETMSSVPMFDRVASFSKPTIAMINGFALGGGCELALACDMRFAADTARLGQPEINLALIPGGGGTQRLTRLAGIGAAMRLILSAEIIDAEEALRIGLVDLVFPAAELRRETTRIASTISRKSPLALRLAKEAIRAAAESPLSQGLALERELFITAFGSQDCGEGVRAFLEKRDPLFTGA
jgi:enoyl-CoA hydratase